MNSELIREWYVRMIPVFRGAADGRVVQYFSASKQWLNPGEPGYQFPNFCFDPKNWRLAPAKKRVPLRITVLFATPWLRWDTAAMCHATSINPISDAAKLDGIWCTANELMIINAERSADGEHWLPCSREIDADDPENKLLP